MLTTGRVIASALLFAILLTTDASDSPPDRHQRFFRYAEFGERQGIRGIASPDIRAADLPEGIASRVHEYIPAYVKHDFDCVTQIVAMPIERSLRQRQLVELFEDAERPYITGEAVALQKTRTLSDFGPTFENALSPSQAMSLSEEQKAWRITKVEVEDLGWQPFCLHWDRTIGVTFANGVNVVYKQPRGRFRFCQDAWVIHDGVCCRNNWLSDKARRGAPDYIKILRPPQPWAFY